MPRRGSNVLGVGCVTLFALPFATVGVFAAYLALRQAGAWFEARGWVAAAAVVESVRLDPEYAAEDSGVVGMGSDAPVEVSYRYELRDRVYRGDRLWLLDGRDTVDSFYQQAYRELAEAGRTGRAVVCFVDPDRPERSVLYRDLRWRRLAFLTTFVLIFGGVGFGLLGGLAVAWRRHAESRRFERLHPDRPWLWKRRWRGARIKPSVSPHLIGLGLLAWFWNLLAWPMLLLPADRIFDPSNRPALVLFLFPVAGLVLAALALRSRWRWRRFSGCELELDPLPVPPGGPLSGRILSPRRLAVGIGPLLRLSCMQRASEGDRREFPVWEHETRLSPARVAFDGAATVIPVEIDLPPDARQTDEGVIAWWLEAQGSQPGLDFAVRFEIPVFRRPA